MVQLVLQDSARKRPKRPVKVGRFVTTPNWRRSLQRKCERVGFKVVVEVAVYNNMTSPPLVVEEKADRNSCGPDELYMLA